MDTHYEGSLPLSAQLVSQVELTVGHILLQCASFTKACDDFFSVTVTSVSELFSKSRHVY
jgi:hypothetical protein